LIGRTARGVLFDAYGTLFDVYSIAALAEQMFPGNGSALAALWRDKQVEYTRLRTLSDRYADFLTVTEEALRYGCARLHLDLGADHVRRLLEQYRRLSAFPDVLPTLADLRSRGIALAILSNGTPDMLETAIAAAGLSGQFTHVLSADTVRKYKTSAEVYALGVAAFGCPAAELLFVSSNGWDACGARWFGYRSYWVNRAQHPAEQLGIAANGEGRTLTDLIGFLRTD
jgi:2-haloacid dehalogenase